MRSLGHQYTSQVWVYGHSTPSFSESTESPVVTQSWNFGSVGLPVFEPGSLPLLVWTYISHDMLSCRMFDRQRVRRAFSRARFMAGMIIAMRIAMMPMTTRSSTSVNPRRLDMCFFLGRRVNRADGAAMGGRAARK